MQTQTKIWQQQATRLDLVLFELELARSRNHAAQLIATGAVSINGKVITKPGKQVNPADTIAIRAEQQYVSRGAYKLISALENFRIEPAQKMCLDLGASTGGFTEVLLEKDALEVIALDVGHNQLAQKIRENPKVRVVEGFNARNLDPQSLQEAAKTTVLPQLIVGDLSFISLQLILPAIAKIAPAGAEIILLIKPQFEVGQKFIKNGIVANAAAREQALQNVLDCAEKCGFELLRTQLSPIAGTHGNTEYLAAWKVK